ncbi:MAG: peptidase domain-containing ABC transporter [Moraxella sp.]|nr:peptidase domain-containing ABC transporter [Moraxella sp.]
MNKQALNRLSLGWVRRTPLILQTEASECGLACIAMIAGFYGYHTDLFALRQRFAISQKGATLAHLINIAKNLDLSCRPLRLELHELYGLKVPCILHWDLNHFVVLTNITANKVTILDPAFGKRVLDKAQLSHHFTGIALEVWANADFKPKQEKQPLSLVKLFGSIRGIGYSLSQILLLALVLEIFALITPFFMQWVIDHAIVSADTSLLMTLALGFALLMLLNNSIGLLQSWMVMYLSTTLNVQLKSGILGHLLRLPSEYFQKRHLGDVVSRFGSIDTIQSTLTTTFITAILDGLMVVFTLILMFIYSPTLSWIAMIAIVLYALLRWIWYSPLKQATQEQIIHGANQSSHFMESMRGVKAIRRYGKQDYRQSVWLSLFVNQVNAGLTTQKLGLAFSFINGLVFGLENIIIIYLGAKFVIEGVFTVGVLMAFLAYKNQFGSRVGALIDKYIELKMLSIHSDRLSDIVLQKQEVQEHLSNEFNSEEIKQGIQVKNLKFRYTEDEAYIIDNLSFSVQDKQTVAIIGKSGCGKSTLMSLLTGELTPSSGEIIIAGKPVHNITELNSRQLMAYVAQEDMLFSGSLLDNISFFDEKADKDWVMCCAQMACVHEDIMTMPMGYQTLIGDMGSVLSGGQKQRIILARALYQKPKILFLDEATSHLDVATEQAINQSLNALNITKVIIAHRPETIKMADKVIDLSCSDRS